MHVPTHIMAGWCLANCLPLNARQRFGCMAASAIPDLDGVGIIFGMDSDAYQNFHHVLGHNLMFGLLTCGLLAVLSGRFLLSIAVYLGMFHLHLLMDYYGSGPLWPIPYLWPSSHLRFVNPNAWDLYSWQNITIATALLLWTIAIAILRKRTPLEWIMPNLDRQLLSAVPPYNSRKPESRKIS
ncbi:MAG TPA: metal-dependent hydrolase [Tepidisphaeraceae bacterium]|jgi:hypothetical protein